MAGEILYTWNASIFFLAIFIWEDNGLHDYVRAQVEVFLNICLKFILTQINYVHNFI